MTHSPWPRWWRPLWTGVFQGLCRAGPYLAMHNNGIAVPATAEVAQGSQASWGG